MAVAIFKRVEAAPETEARLVIPGMILLYWMCCLQRCFVFLGLTEWLRMWCRAKVFSFYCRRGSEDMYRISQVYRMVARVVPGQGLLILLPLGLRGRVQSWQGRRVSNRFSSIPSRADCYDLQLFHCISLSIVDPSELRLVVFLFFVYF